MTVERFRVEPGAPKDRLDRLVADRYAGAATRVSRAEVQRWIDAGRVRVDGNVAKSSSVVRGGCEVEVDPLPAAASELVPDASVAFGVLYEDAHLLVVDKPTGLVVHPARGHWSGTLVHGLLARGSFDRARWGAEEGDPIERVRPGIVHRIDKGTSGLLVVAKDEAAREGLKQQLAAHTVERVYEAIAVGSTPAATYETLHGRHPRDRLRFTSLLLAGKRAVTHVARLESLASGAATRVECRLETGRTHQIRVHLAEQARTPLLGDALYGKPATDPRVREVEVRLGRPALHARVLGFVHPVTGASLRFESPLPADLAEALAALR